MEVPGEELSTIGEFAALCRLSPKALRLYDEMGLVVPARVDPSSGYRFYSSEQVETARLVCSLRQLDMPLAVIASVLELAPADAAKALVAWWDGVEAKLVERRALVSYLQARLTGKESHMYDIKTRSIPERKLLTINRHVHLDETDAFFHEAFARLRSAATGVDGIAGAPFTVFYGEVSQDSDGPMELCRPVAAGTASSVIEGMADVQLRLEPAHDEAYVRLSKDQMSWPQMLPVCDALASWVAENQRQAAGVLRQVLIADQRVAGSTDLVCDLSVPLR